MSPTRVLAETAVSLPGDRCHPTLFEEFLGSLDVAGTQYVETALCPCRTSSGRHRKLLNLVTLGLISVLASHKQQGILPLGRHPSVATRRDTGFQRVQEAAHGGSHIDSTPLPSPAPPPGS